MMRRLVVTLFLILPGAQLFADASENSLQPELEARLAEALQEYATGLDEGDRDRRLENFRRSERLFAKIIESLAENADLHTNLGNAALLAERIGAATLAYRRALRIDPDHPRARQNLHHVRTLLPTWVPRPEEESLFDTFFFWHRALSRGERSSLAAICFALAALLLAIAVRWRRSIYRNLALVPMATWLALVISLGLEWRAGSMREGVITADEVVARAADSRHAPSRFSEPLPGGTEVEILEERASWLRIRLADGRDAWVNTGSVTALK